MITFRILEYLVALADEGSYSRAAERLFISQPALSQAIRKAEMDIGVELLVKGTHNLRFTPAGELLLQGGRELLARRDALGQRMRDLSAAHRGSLRFGISPFYSKYYLPLVQPYFARHFPDVRIQVVEEISVTIEQMVLDDQLDIGFVPMEPENPRLSYELLHTEEILLAVPPDSPVNVYAIPSPDLPRIDLRHFEGEPFVSLKPVQKFHSMSRRLFERAGFSPVVVHETMNWDTVNALAAGGVESGFVPEMLRNVTLFSRAPRYYRLEGQNATRAYSAAWKKGSRPSPLALQLMELFRNNLSLLNRQT